MPDAPHDRTPVVVGVAQATQRVDDPLAARSPVDLMADAVRLAVLDGGLDAGPEFDALWVVRSLSCRARNPGRAIGRAAGISARRYGLSDHGGDTPQRLVNRACVAIAAGEAEAIVITGGEAARSRRRARAAGIELDWFTTDDTASDEPDVLTPPMEMNDAFELERGIRLPIEMYPIFESALRAAAGRTPADHVEHLARLWERFSAVAADNPYAWDRKRHLADEIRTVTPTNRMVGLPYTKSMNANNDVDMTAALVVTSAERARSLGVPRDRWVFPWSGVDCHEHLRVSERFSLAETPAIRAGARLALELAATSIHDVSYVDLYSCFPSAVQYGLAALELDDRTTPTVTGGLPFAGGPFNNYSMHAIATVCRLLRESPDDRGLVWANGGFATKHAFGVYSGRPSPDGFRHASPQARLDATPRRAVTRSGTGRIEGYTVMHERDGSPSIALASVITTDGSRTWGNSRDAETVAAMCHDEWVGRAMDVSDDGTMTPGDEP